MNQPSRAIPYLIALVTLIVFGNLCRGEFTSWDDIYNVSYNPRLNPPTFGKVAWYWTHSANGLYIPVTYTVWGLLAKVAYLDHANELGIRLNPYVFHTASVLVHVASALLVYAIVRLLVPHAWAACAGALVFALHPVQVEAVGWVAGLKDVLCGCLSFAAIWTYLLAVRAAVDSPRERPAQAMFYTLATVLLVLAMLAKPTAMVVPAVAFVLHVWGLRRPAREAAMALLPWFVLAAGCAVVAKLAQPAHGVPGAPLWARPLLAGDAIAFYLYKLVFPAWLGIDYGWRPQAVVGRWWFYVLWFVPILLALWLVRNRKRRPELFAAGAVFALGVAPVLGSTTFLFQYFSTVADHYLYISMLGPAIAVAWFVSQRSTRDTFAIATTVLVILVARSMLQTRVWQNDFTLFTNAVRVNPDSFMAWRNLGYAHRFGGSADEAERALRRAIELKPDYWEARQDLAQILFADGRAHEAIAQVEESIRIKSRLPAVLGIDYTEDLIKFGDTLMSLDRHAEAARQYRLALERRPLNATLRQKLIEAESKSKATTTTTPANGP